MKIEKARELAAQIWCEPKNMCTEMDVNLAESFARILVVAVGESEIKRETLVDRLDASEKLLKATQDQLETMRRATASTTGVQNGV